MRDIGTFNPAMLVHGEQRVTLHKPIPPDGSATVTSRIVGIYDKGKAAVVATETTAIDPGGEPLYTTYLSAFIRGEGGWGGDRGPGGARNEPPEREPDHAVTYQTSPTRPSSTGCRATATRSTPTRSSPPWAASTGPSCTACARYGFTGRALLHALAGSDPARFHHIEGRFSSPVLPGDALTISMWRTADGEAVFHDGQAGRHRRDRPGSGPLQLTIRRGISIFGDSVSSDAGRARLVPWWPQNSRSSSGLRPRSSS